MANEVSYTDPAGATGKYVYARLRTPTNTFYNGSAFEAYNAAHWALYARTLADSGGGLYLGNMPAVAAGAYYLDAYLGPGTSGSPGTPTSADTLLGATPYPMQWSGTAEIALGSSAVLPSTPPAGYGPIGTGSVLVDEDYPTADNLSYKTAGGTGIEGATVNAYLASEYATSPATATVRGQTVTLESGGWANVMRLDPGSYVVVFTHPSYKASTRDLTVT